MPVGLHVSSVQTLKDWHMVLIALVITGVGVAVLVIRSGLQRNPPRNVTDAEESEGQTVSLRQHRPHDPIIPSRVHSSPPLHHCVLLASRALVSE